MTNHPSDIEIAQELEDKFGPTRGRTSAAQSKQRLDYALSRVSPDRYPRHPQTGEVICPHCEQSDKLSIRAPKNIHKKSGLTLWCSRCKKGVTGNHVGRPMEENPRPRTLADREYRKRIARGL